MATFSECFKNVDEWADYATDVMRYCFYEEKARTGKVDKKRCNEWAQSIIRNGMRVEDLWVYGMSYILETGMKPNYSIIEFYDKHPGMDVTTDVLYDMFLKYGTDFKKAQLYILNQTDVYEMECNLNDSSDSN